MLKESWEAAKLLFKSSFSSEAENIDHDNKFSTYDDLPNASHAVENFYMNWDGDKFIGGYGETELLRVDYWTLRQRSTELFQKNLYARGIIRRFVTNVISTGIELEAQPDANILGLEDDYLDEWSEGVESLWGAWSSQPILCDAKGLKTFGAIQAEAYRAAMVSGDVLVTLPIDKTTSLPKIQLISGNKVSQPLLTDEIIPEGTIICEGVELDQDGKHIAFWVQQDNGKWIRIPAYGPTSGRKTAWLIYGADKMLDEVRGQPLLALVLQSLKEIDRYRDSAQRKAVVNSFLAMFIQRDADKQPTFPTMRMATSELDVKVESGTDTKNLNVKKLSPGIAIDGLAVGEKPVLLGGEGTDTNFPDFESTIIHSVAWCLECPPEILQMSFDRNYAASQAALHEYRIVINFKRAMFGIEMNQPVYEQFLILQTLSSKITANGFIEAWQDISGQWEIFSAWVRADWFGTIKPATDILKTVKAYQSLIDGGFITYGQATRELTGKKWRVPR